MENEFTLIRMHIFGRYFKFYRGQIPKSLLLSDVKLFRHFSGNQMGDIGARMLAKALMINTKLRTIYWDRNNTSAQGFQDLASALQK